jgi:hypothetical protein
MRSNNSERVLALVFVLCAVATAQWLTFREPGVPRTPNGQADLIASPPMEPWLKPGLSGVWMHETTTAAEMRRLYGGIIQI